MTHCKKSGIVYIVKMSVVSEMRIMSTLLRNFCSVTVKMRHDEVGLPPPLKRGSGWRGVDIYETLYVVTNTVRI